MGLRNYTSGVEMWPATTHLDPKDLWLEANAG
jgi:hypothetical protein